MEEFNIQGKQTSFYKYCPGTFGYILVLITFHKERETFENAFLKNKISESQ